MTAPNFPQPWGYDQIVSVNATNPINASVQAWKGAAVNELAAVFVFGIIPFLIAMMIYTRTQKIMPSMFGLILSEIALYAFGLIDAQIIIYSLSITVIIGLGIGIYMLVKSKDSF